MISLWKRVIAYLIDVVILGLLVIKPFKKYMQADGVGFGLNAVFIYAIIFLLTLLYFALFEYFFEQTPGKLIIGTNVKSHVKSRVKFSGAGAKVRKLKEEKEGRKPSLNQCLLRNISKISTVFYVLDLLYLLKNKRQRYLEYKTGTETI